MASEVNICNLALAHLGDNATVASIDPPEGSAQAEHCARFYPVARDSLLELHAWKFATKRTRLASIDTESWSWGFAYAEPSDALKLLAVLPPSADSDAQTQPYEPETGYSSADLILCNTEDATLRYISHVTDTTRFSPLFTLTLSWHLASMLAGPIIKGDVGAAEAKRCAAMMQAFLSKAIVSDANQRKAEINHSPTWIQRR